MRRLKITKEIMNTEVTYEVDKYCCKEMENALTIKERNPGNYGNAIIKWKNTKLVMDIHKEGYGSSGDYIKEETIYKLKYCPFCGEKL
jgi:hypothetical protein